MNGVADRKGEQGEKQKEGDRAAEREQQRAKTKSNRMIYYTITMAFAKEVKLIQYNLATAKINL